MKTTPHSATPHIPFHPKLLDTLLSKLLAKLGLDRLMGGTGLTKLLVRAGIHAPVSSRPT